MSKAKRKPKRLLRLALKRRDYIRIVRRIKQADSVDGHVVALGSSWVLLAVSPDGSPGGYVALPIADISRIEWASGARFVKRSLRAQGAWPPATPLETIDLDGSVCATVDSIATAVPLITVHVERKRPDVCFIGQPHAWGRRKLHLQQVDPQGRWQRKLRGHKIASITRVDFGGVYEANLAAVAGPRPVMGEWVSNSW